ncbi:MULTISPECIES: metallophosphoesterase [unclassified Microbacterium]|uniref:metallophosphoesterase n=1 Tax=unclassified Microbacterium TaxID=2609290 RepID=UPI000EA9C5E4|nr:MULTISPECIES: metallophosphoesterase [unclassified Microbacterium]MBT2485900.1 metallophosphoesterase [Microbacterium sp. ISL-108]RKN68655.1 metallophosphatase family protein [Microbacterium sp. CGR2]
MRALEHAPTIALPDQRVAVCGDWHGNIGWARMISQALPRLAPDVTTILHLGDWQMPPAETDETFAGTSINRIYVTLGNHEPWGQITPLLDKHPGEAVRISELIWLLPRPARLTIGGRSVLSLGGAASVDRESREEGRTWWPDEAVSDAHVAAAIAGGPADLMLTHESPANTPVRPVREILRTNPHGFPSTALAASAASRARISEVWDAVRPELLAHGHLHAPGGGRTEDGRRVASLGREGQEANLAILDMRTLKMATPHPRIIRGLAEQYEDDYLDREKRAKGAAEALHSGVLDGLVPTAGALQDAQDYIDGRRTLDELIEDVRRRHTRPEDKP